MNEWLNWPIRAKYDLYQLRYEKQTIHEYVMAFPQFCQAIWLIVWTYQQQACQSGLHPYTCHPLNLNQPWKTPSLLRSLLNHWPAVSHQNLLHHPKMLILGPPTPHQHWWHSMQTITMKKQGPSRNPDSNQLWCPYSFIFLLWNMQMDKEASKIMQTLQHITSPM